MMRVRCYIFLTTDDRQPRDIAEHNPVWIEKGIMGENGLIRWFGYEKTRIEEHCMLEAEVGSQLKKIHSWPIYCSSHPAQRCDRGLKALDCANYITST